MVRDSNSLVSLEVKARDGITPSLNALISNDTYADVHYGIKFGDKILVLTETSIRFRIFLHFS